MALVAQATVHRGVRETPAVLLPSALTIKDEPQRRGA